MQLKLVKPNLPRKFLKHSQDGWVCACFTQVEVRFGEMESGALLEQPNQLLEILVFCEFLRLINPSSHISESKNIVYKHIDDNSRYLHIHGE